MPMLVGSLALILSTQTVMLPGEAATHVPMPLPLIRVQGRYDAEFDARRRVYRGKNKDFGKDYEVSRDNRRVTGTGKTFSSGYDTVGKTIVGTGQNFGAGWYLSGNGREWIGTGKNFGKRCPARGPTSYLACS